MKTRFRDYFSCVLPESWFVYDEVKQNHVRVPETKVEPEELHLLMTPSDVNSLLGKVSYSTQLYARCFPSEKEALAAIHQPGEHWILTVTKKVKAEVNTTVILSESPKETEHRAK